MTDILLPRPRPAIQVTEEEYERLADIVCASPVETDGIALLWSELRRAKIVHAADAPNDLVRLYARVRYRDLGTGERRTVRLTPPDEADPDQGDISIESPLGAALLGLRPGAVFRWTSAAGRRRIRVEKVTTPQPPLAIGRR